MTKRLLCVCLALVLLFGVLAGCSKNEAQTADDTKKTEQSDTEDKTSTQFAYQAQYFDLPEDIQWIGTSCVTGDTLYFTASIPDGGTETYTDENGEEYSYDTYSEVIFRFDLDTGECVQLDNYVAEPVVENPDMPDGVTMNPDGSMQTFNSSTNIQTMAAGADGTLWLYRQTSRYADDGTEGDSISELIQLDAHGTLLRTITPVSDEETDDTDSWRYTYIDSILSDDKGYVYTYDYQTVNVYGPDGSFVFSKSGDELNGQICQLSASEVGMTTSSADGKMVFKQLDPETKDWGKETPVSSRAWNILPGNDVYTYFFTSSGSIFGERKDNGEVEKVVDWIACDVDSNSINSDRFGFLSDGRIVAVTYEYSDNDPSRQQVLVLNRVDAAAVTTKTELTLACLYLDYNLRSQIVKFNKSNPDYRIVVKDYSEYATDDDYNAGLTKLNTEIISGNVPDILVNGTELPIGQYAAKGLLEDLWPYLDADPEYSRDKLMTQPLNAAQTDGKLYRLPIDFGVTTAVGLGKVVGEYTTWTLADVNDALSKLPEGATVFNKYYTQAEMLKYCIAMNAENFMNWQDGTCSFDSDEFRALLEFVKPFPAEYDWQSDAEEYESDYTRLKNGKQLLYPTSLSGFSDLYYTFAALNNDIRFIGFPREDGSSGNAFNASCTLSISTTCKDKSGAWAFIRSTLSDDYQESIWNYPIVKSVFEAKAQEAMTQEYETDADGNQILDDDGNPIPISSGGMSYGNEPMIELYAVTQEQYDAVLALIDSTTTFVDYDQNVLDIISDEAAGYFAGSKTVEEASKLIQSRVSLYIQEQK
jgi:ABC-type glycerol-3-phosphate transport system substrate-binding protein